MNHKLTVGLSKTIELPDQGSVNASCSVELELSDSLTFHDVELLHHEAEKAFKACHKAVEDELACHSRAPTPRMDRSPTGNGHAHRQV